MTTYFYILTNWNAAAGRRGHHPNLDQFTVDWEDVTGQPHVASLPTNLVLFKCQLPGDDAAPIINHPDYGAGAILETEVVDENGDTRPTRPDASQFSRVRSLLEQKGLTNEQVNAAVGGSPSGRTGKEIAERLVVWLKDDRDPGLATLELEEPPMAKFFGMSVPVSSKAVWTNIIQPIAQAVSE